MYGVVLLNFSWQTSPLCIIYLPLNLLQMHAAYRTSDSDERSLNNFLLFENVWARQDSDLLPLQTHLDEKVNPHTQGHTRPCTNTQTSSEVSSEGAQREDVNNGWHQRPIHPHTPLTTSSEGLSHIQTSENVETSTADCQRSLEYTGKDIVNSLSVMLLNICMIKAVLTHIWPTGEGM